MSKIYNESPRLEFALDATSVCHGSRPPTPKNNTPPSCASPDASSAARLLGAFWRSPDRH